MPWDLHNSLEWDLVLRQSYQATPLPTPTGRYGNYFRPIPGINIAIDTHILAIGIDCNHAKPWWKWGGTASMKLLTLPSSTSKFVAAMKAAEVKCQLFHLNLVRFPNLDVSQYLLNFEIPYYFEQASLEIWKYSGPTDDTTVEINLSG